MATKKAYYELLETSQIYIFLYIHSDLKYVTICKEN